MLDIFGLEKDVLKIRSVDKMSATLKLREIHQLAEANIHFYKKYIEGKQFDSPEPWESSYLYDNNSVVGGGFRSANGLPRAERIVRHPGNRQTKTYPLLFLFYDFCLAVRQLTNNYLTEPQPKGKRNNTNKPPDLQFIDYLDTDNNQKALEYLKEQFSGQRGQVIAYMILSLKGSAMLKTHNLKNLCLAIQKELGNTFTYQAIHKTKIPEQDKSQKQYKIYKEIRFRIAANIQKKGY